MAEAKITLSTIVNDEGLQKLNTDLAKSQNESKRLQREIRQLEKNTSAADKQTDAYNKKLEELTKRLNESRQASKSINRQINSTISALEQGNNASGGFVDKLKEMASLTGVSTNLMGISAAVIAIGGGMINAGREISKLSNQFIAFARDSKEATIIYNKFNDVYRNTNFDEQRVYDMGKAFLSVGMSAEEAAQNIERTADASAKFGLGVEFAEELNQAMIKLYTGSQLSEKQYQALAQAGIDLSDVQDKMAKGGMVAYEALREKLTEYAGAMGNAKQTAEEMEGDIKGNMVEIARQTALLIDDFFGFSDALKGFYQWVIDTSQAVINSIKNMRNALNENIASANAYSQAIASYGKEYDEVMEAASKGDKAAAERLMVMQQQATIMAQEAKDAEALKNREQEITALQNKRAQVKAISVKAGGSGGGSKASTTKDTTGKEFSKAYQFVQQSNNQEYNQLKQSLEFKKKSLEISQKMALVGASDSETVVKSAGQKIASLEMQKEIEGQLYEKRIANMDEEVKYLTEHPFDGSDKKLESLNTQIEAEKTLHQQRIDLINQQIELQTKQNEVDIFQNSSKLTTVQTQWQNYAKSVSASMGQAVASVVNGEKSMGEALKEMAKQMITNALQMLAQWVALVAILAAFGDETPARHASVMMFGNDGSYMKNKDGKGGIVKAGSSKASGVKAATGGYITGAGTSTSDSIPAMLSNGEYVLNASATDRLGVKYLDALNAGANPVGDASPVGGSSITLNVSAIDSSGFSDFLGHGGLDAIREALFENNKRFATEVGIM